MNKNIKQASIWLLRLIAAGLMMQTLFFKFTGSDESVYIFTRLGMEPVGRIGTGVMELIASMLILFPKTSAYGGILAMGLMSGAIFFHLSKLGIEVMNDGGQLFIYAVIVFLCSLALVIIYRLQIFSFIKLNAKYHL